MGAVDPWHHGHAEDDPAQSRYADGEPDLPALRAHVIDRLPPYARPLFLRLRSELETTPTFKYAKNEVVEQGYRPALTTDPIYLDWPDRGALVRLDRTLFDAIHAGEIRL